MLVQLQASNPSLLVMARKRMIIGNGWVKTYSAWGND